MRKENISIAQKYLIRTFGEFAKDVDVTKLTKGSVKRMARKAFPGKKWDCYMVEKVLKIVDRRLHNKVQYKEVKELLDVAPTDKKLLVRFMCLIVNPNLINEVTRNSFLKMFYYDPLIVEKWRSEFLEYTLIEYFQERKRINPSCDKVSVIIS